VNSPVATIEVPRALRLPARGSLFWLAVAPLAALAVAALAMHVFGISGGDGTLTYGIVYYLLAQFVPGVLLTVVTGGLLPLLFHLYLRDGSWEDGALPHGRALLHKDAYGFMVFTAPAAGVYALRFDLARTAEAELRQ
jgi:alkylation response protein AidB-like acyl-CoA dehydrogenase